MAIVSDDPTWWSTINAYTLVSITEGTPSPRSQKGKEGLLPSKYKPRDSGIVLSDDESIPARNSVLSSSSIHSDDDNGDDLDRVLLLISANP
ncbi:uncharacterized protein F5891DRAFT_1189528 [Suillus fuscotomentosus]|uniref:Uncharacterized protein n=1 Tax=Suillus fuscotomentosus TaxID=1912939 RepID=A0AAD4E7E9_9AGAM|nr:uncharacterized protein F5891DRAFT_1189528 [Suillus fuscotomentosus]KAG1899718.1 hypothetical protein F5891DRAFT_1189528 [Suillus fuscotomentosus]